MKVAKKPIKKKPKKKPKHECTDECLNAIHSIRSPKGELGFIRIYHGKVDDIWWLEAGKI